MTTSREVMYSLGDGKIQFQSYFRNEDGFSQGALYRLLFNQKNLSTGHGGLSCQK